MTNPCPWLNMTLCGDCLALLPGLPDKCVDMVLCDLPYGTTQNKWDSVIPFEPLWAQYRRIVKPNAAIVLTAQIPFSISVGASNLQWLKYEWIWEKQQGTGFLNAKRYPLKVHENILVFCGGQHTYNPQMVPGKPYKVGSSNTCKTNYGAFDKTLASKEPRDTRYPTTIIHFDYDRDKRVHPTQKPVALFEYLIRTYTNEGDTVLDNCCGSGTTGVACRNTGRNFIQMDNDIDYCEIAENRLEGLTVGPKISAAAVRAITEVGG